jgi:hypothetical protein
MSQNESKLSKNIHVYHRTLVCNAFFSTEGSQDHLFKRSSKWNIYFIINRSSKLIMINVLYNDDFLMCAGKERKKNALSLRGRSKIKFPSFL